MSTERAHALVADFESSKASSRARWLLERSAVAGRLHELIDTPDQVRQGRLNLCGPAAMFAVWFRRDPEAATSYAIRLFEEGRSAIGDLAVRPSWRLRRALFDGGLLGEPCPAADWMMMAALRDSTNRMLRYSHPGGPREAAAAITMPGAMRRWLTATGLFAAVRDETTLVRRLSLDHARSLPADADVFVLLAQEMLRTPARWIGRARDHVVGLVPNHWILLRSPVELTEKGEATFRFWSWGGLYAATVPRHRFVRGYHGCLVGEKPLRLAEGPA